MTESAGAGPAFATVIVKTTVVPTRGVASETVLRRERSACAETVRLSDAKARLVPAFVLVRSDEVFA